MPNLASIVKRVFLHQTLVYFQNTGPDRFGKPSYVGVIPVEIPCRWEDKQVEIITYDGRRIHAKAYLLLVNYLVPGSLVWLGTLEQLQVSTGSTNPPTVLQGGREVLNINTTPDLKASSYIYEAWL